MFDGVAIARSLSDAYPGNDSIVDRAAHAPGYYPCQTQLKNSGPVSVIAARACARIERHSSKN